jgi:hypothetical protein
MVAPAVGGGPTAEDRCLRVKSGMHEPERASGSDRSRRADGLLFAAMATLAGLLGCYELFDTDVWWHLRTGQWILEHHRVPRLDPFTFSSAGRPWIDLHWGFQVALAAADALAGVPGMILLASLTSASALAITMTARRSDWPAWVVALCWLPALALMATRFDPRPEVFSLAFLACFLAVLFHVERRPALAWLLVPIQVLWVNMHGLFILGPIILGCYWLDRVARRWLESRSGVDSPEQVWPPLWRHLAPASAATALAMLANPYGIRGALLPLELLPKIADANNPYKSYIDEFASLRSAVYDQVVAGSGIHFHLRIQVFLLLMIGWSFLPPVVMSTRQGSSARRIRSGVLQAASSMVVLVTLALIAALGLPLPETPPWLSSGGRAVPVLLLIAGVVAAGLAAFRSRAASATIAIGTAAAAAWAIWLRTYLFEDGLTRHGIAANAIPYAGAGLGIVAAGVIVRAGFSLFRMLLAAVFTYLSFQAVRNINLFAMAGGAVLAWNLGEWSAQIAPARPNRLAIWWPRVMLLALIVAWSVGVATNRYYALIGDDVHFGLRERPSTFAHEAARFAGRPGLPDQALVFHLGQAGVYVYHNGPGYKVFIDGRLEVPSLSSFQNYVRIQDQLSRNDARWDVAVSRLGDPLILIGHDGWSEAEATLLAHPRWRCIYFDEVASIFVTRSGASSAPGVLEFDFTSVPRAEPASTSASPNGHRLIREAETLFRLGTVLRKRGGDPWRRRIPILMGASGRTRALLARDAADPAYWRLLGLVEWEMVPDLSHPPPGPADPWDPAEGLSWARATYCLRRALAAGPADIPTLKAMAACFGVRRMSEARRGVESLLSGTGPSGDLFRPLEEPLARIAGSAWPEADRAAAAFLHLGNPQAARRVWSEAANPPSEAVRLTRMAGAELAALDAVAAEVLCQQALRLDPQLGEAWFVLAAARLEAGRMDEVAAASREALRCELTADQRERILGVQTLLSYRR